MNFFQFIEIQYMRVKLDGQLRTSVYVLVPTDPWTDTVSGLRVRVGDALNVLKPLLLSHTHIGRRGHLRRRGERRRRTNSDSQDRGNARERGRSNGSHQTLCTI